MRTRVPWDQADQYVHLPNREIVILVSKVMIIFAPFHLFDAAAVSIPARGVIPLCSLGCIAKCAKLPLGHP